MFNALLRLLTEAVGANAAAEPTRREEMVSFILGYIGRRGVREERGQKMTHAWELRLNRYYVSPQVCWHNRRLRQPFYFHLGYYNVVYIEFLSY